MAFQKKSLSVIIITYNEAENLFDCLESVADIAEEIIIVDSGSQDATAAIAQQFGARWIVNTTWPGFGAQKNLALSHARCDWVLSIDADERLTPTSKQEISNILDQNTAPHAGYFIPRQSYFLGKPVKHCGWFPDYVLRLFRREHGQFSDSYVHEHIIVNTSTGKLKHPLIHYSYRYLDDVITKINRYAQAGAKQLYKKRRPTFLAQAEIHALAAWIRTLIFKRGILDGWTGLRIANMNAQTAYKKYAQLRQLWKTSSSL